MPALDASKKILTLRGSGSTASSRLSRSVSKEVLDEEGEGITEEIEEGGGWGVAARELGM